MTLPAELRPTKHVFVPDDLTKGDTCEVCGEVDAFGGLHLTPRGEFDTDDPQPEPCTNGCPHYAHTGPCTGGYPGDVPCRCGAS